MHARYDTRLLALLAGTLACSASAGWTKQGDGSSAFRATGPAGFKILGTTRRVEVSDDGQTFTASIKLAEVDTDNSLRNRHMLEDLEAARYPSCALSVPSASIKEGATDVHGTGTFWLHGKSKEVPFTYSTRCNEGVCEVEGSAEIDLRDFEVKVRSYLGITVKPEVTVSTRFQIKR